MRFDELDTRMRVYETAHDLSVLPGIFIVARLDGRGFTRLTKEVHRFEAPFDERFRDLMVATTAHLMDCGFRIIYGYTQSDEISLVLHRDEDAFGRKVRKLNSILASEASSKVSRLLEDVAVFDCRLCELPNLETLVDYLRWRSEDAHRNALNGHCYWTLRREGRTAQAAADSLARLSVAQKNELLFQSAGVNFNDLPNWQKRGVGLYWRQYEKQAINPSTGESVTATRRGIKIDMKLPMRDDYSDFVRNMMRCGRS